MSSIKIEKNKKSEPSSDDRNIAQREVLTNHQFTDNRPEAIAQRKLQEKADNSVQAKEFTQLQAKINQHSNQVPIQKKGNKTGLPDDLKSGIENLSGHSLDDVKVHRNSPKPAQLNAHAYAQGTNIHLGPGQEKHLPHEAWHVVQQKQGRVKPTMQMKGKVNINDDKGLEQEADVMGAKAMQMKSFDDNTPSLIKRDTGKIIQKKVSEKTNSVIQLVRGFSKYGAAMQGDPDPAIAVAGPRNQGPHTIAHAAIAAVEAFIDDTSTLVFSGVADNVDKYDLFVKHGIILKPGDFDRKRKAELLETKANRNAFPGIGADPKKAIAPDASLDARSASYLDTYKAVHANCLFWYKKALSAKKAVEKRRNDGKSVTEAQTEKYLIYNGELEKALNDIRDLNPSATYADKQVEGYTHDQIVGKGEPTTQAYIDQIKTVIAQQKAGHYPTSQAFVDDLIGTIMHKADVGDLLPAEKTRVDALANSYVNILRDLLAQRKV